MAWPASGSRLKTSQRRAGLVFAVPVIVLELLLPPVPIGQAIYFSFTGGTGSRPPGSGPRTTAAVRRPDVLARDREQPPAAGVDPVRILIPLLVAYLLNEHVPAGGSSDPPTSCPPRSRGSFIGMVALRVFAGEGILNHVLSAVGLGFVHTDLLSGEVSAMVAVAIHVHLVGVRHQHDHLHHRDGHLDRDVYEAARVDGAGAFTTFIEITIPMLMRFIQFAFILTLITAFTALFSLIFVMTGAGPVTARPRSSSTSTSRASRWACLGTPPRSGIVLFAIVFAVSLAQLRIFRSRLD